MLKGEALMYIYYLYVKKQAMKFLRFSKGTEHSGIFLKISSKYIAPEYLYFDGTEYFGTFQNIY